MPINYSPKFQWNIADRAQKMNPSVIRELLKLTEQPGIISFAGGLPSPSTFPVSAFKDACSRVLANDPIQALQYAASEGYAPLREMIAQQLPWDVDPSQIIVTNGSQQGLDLIAKVLVDSSSKVLVESPTYLGALMAFSPMEPQIVNVQASKSGIDISDFKTKSPGARFMYVVPNFQNPTGRTMSEDARIELVQAAANASIPLIEDNPYGDLWFDAPPPPPLASLSPEGCLYLGSFSKILAPGLRIGFLVSPRQVFPKLLQAKQAADLHSSGFNQRVIHEIIKNGFLDTHVPTIRSLYRSQRDAMLTALATYFPFGNTQEDEISWNAPSGGMFLWMRLPKNMRATDLLPKSLAAGVAFVPGESFFSENPDPRSIRLSFVTVSVEEINLGIQKLASVISTYQF